MVLTLLVFPRASEEHLHAVNSCVTPLTYKLPVLQYLCHGHENVTVFSSNDFALLKLLYAHSSTLRIHDCWDEGHSMM